MDLKQLESIASQELTKHGLHGWTFGLANTRRRLGVCKYRAKRIEIAEYYARNSPPETVMVEVDNYLCAGNFGETTVALPRPITIPIGQPLPLAWGVTGVATSALQVTLQLSAREPMLLALPS